MPKPEPKPEVVPKPEPKPPEPAPKPAELPKPEPKPTVTPKPEPKLPEPAPKPVETPKPVEPPKPEPKTVEPPKPAPAVAAAAKPEPQLPKPEAKTATPSPKSAPTTVSATNNAEASASAAQKTTEPPKESIEFSVTPGAPLDLITLSPMPATPSQTASVPIGEARGRFVISPDPNLNGSDAEPGFKTGTPSPKVGIGNTTGAPARKGAAPKGEPAASAKAGSISGPASAKTAAGTTAGGGFARTAGAGSGTATTAGNSSGSAPAKKPFAGITIVGGNYEPGSDADMPPVTRAVRPLQTAYGLNIISTEDSGGGLPFFGVFSHEQIYTVYLDMRTVEADPDPSWTFEFALIQDSSSSPAVRDLSRSQQGLVLPFPSAKEKPAWPAGLVHKYAGKMIIVYGLINTEGKMEQISVKDSPDPLLNEPVVRALGKWIFRPAQSEGQPVPAKALFGIPLWAPE